MTVDHPAARPGIALLVTLVILALLAVFLTEFAFETNLETRGIRNFQSSFRARNAVKSLFKAALIGLQGGLDGKKLTERKFLEQLSLPPQWGGSGSFLNPARPEELPEILISKQLPGLAESFPNVIFYTPYIRPIDHLFNLNRINPKNEPGKKKDREVRNEFSNIMQSITIEQKPDKDLPPVSMGLGLEAIPVFYASIYEWADENDEFDYPDSRIEQHRDLETDWTVKNAPFDRLEEIVLIQSKLVQDGHINLRIPLRSESIDQDSWDRYFTTFPVGNREGEKLGSPRINVNLASKEEIEEFLNRHVDPTIPLSNKRQKYISSAEDIGSVLQPEDPLGKKEEYLSFYEIKSRLRGNPTTSDLDDYHKNFFILYSSWYQIQLKAEIENVAAEVRAVIELERDDKGQVRQLSGEYQIHIHDFQLL